MRGRGGEGERGREAEREGERERERERERESRREEEWVCTHVVSLVNLFHGGCKVTVDKAQRRMKQVEPCTHTTLVALVTAGNIETDDDTMMTLSHSPAPPQCQ